MLQTLRFLTPRTLNNIATFLQPYIFHNVVENLQSQIQQDYQIFQVTYQ